ncbi:MAG: HWE histidine kinase domain-containing protein, partial [Pseudomonadota bacterium]
VQAEAVSGGMEPFLGLNFPAWDIPPQARSIMLETSFRYIGDIAAEPVPVLSAKGADADLNLTHAHLRGVSPVHLRYLKNMGSEATFTLNLVVGGKLWGMISMHHPEPRIPDHAVREVCRNFKQVFELTLDGMIQRKRLARLHRASNLASELKSQAAQQTSPSFFNQAILDQLRETMHSEGAVLVKDGVTMNSGVTPGPEYLPRLIEFGNSLTEPFYSHRLDRDYPSGASIVGPEFAGLHVTPMREDCFIAFLRRDREQVTSWAGAPEKTIVGSGADARLNPRGSFAAYKETVRGTSRPWSAEEHQIANDVWAILVSSERQALIHQTTRQQKLVIDELNHRVRNLLTLIRSLSRQSRSTSENINDYVATLEARIEAVATAHSLAVQKTEAFVSLHKIFEIEAEPYNIDETRVVLQGDDAGIRPDIAPIFALVIHELMTNAAKYGCLSQTSGFLEITLNKSPDGLSITWREENGPPVMPPTRKGFGSTLLSKAIPNEIGGTIALSYPVEGVRAVIKLPNSVLSGARFVGTTKSETAHDSPLAPKKKASRADLRCLLVEDSFVVSMDTVRVMNEVGLEQIQTAMTLEEAMSSLTNELPDFAILDVNLSAGQTSLPIARFLRDRDVPFFFVTGYGVDGVPDDLFPTATILRKPLRRSMLDASLHEVGL